ncbi:PepSY domain-containing protein [Methylicorpusculum sp.]|uniref:PepSY-associated TM helix domain-containing protein n=1 Tax=Methylicorpusculum sp. TaxID=2713644 RepID=UPI002720810A|nr:PepSY-associated TM helix domain-containing protein [Methylicorpusculum sp.]MDO8844056.1 PepSY-associated TM helix domain-containing protein [Methylicorpusculum sp.]
MTRYFWVLLHRYAGLAMAGFLIIVGLTGSLLAFFTELERIINPHWYPVHTQEKALDAATLAEWVGMREPRLQVKEINLESFYGGATGAWVTPRTDPATGEPYELGYNHIILDPVTGAEIERRTWGVISESWGNLMSFVYNLHYSLALDMTGIWILGICALIWTLDCFVGFYLTLPARRKPRSLDAARQNPGITVDSPLPDSARAVSGRQSNRSFWQRWQPAWKIRWRAGSYKLNFDLHRAGGLWLWAMLLIFAWSSVYMNLWDTVYTWTTRAVFDYKAPWTELRPLAKPIEQPLLSWRQAQARGEALMSEQARLHDFVVERPVALKLDRETGTYTWQVHSNREIDDHSRRYTTQVIFDANNGELKLVLLPSGQYTGNTVSNWLYALHMANVFGLPYRIFVCLLGLAIVILSITGIVIWLRKRRAARLMRKAGAVSCDCG